MILVVGNIYVINLSQAISMEKHLNKMKILDIYEIIRNAQIIEIMEIKEHTENNSVNLVKIVNCGNVRDYFLSRACGP